MDGQWSKPIQTSLESDGCWNSGSVLPVILSKLLNLVKNLKSLTFIMCQTRLVEIKS